MYNLSEQTIRIYYEPKAIGEQLSFEISAFQADCGRARVVGRHSVPAMVELYASHGMD